MKGHGSLNCGGCGAKLVNCLFFCLPCWQLLPGKERAAGFATSGLTLEKQQRCKEILDRAEVPTDGRMMA